ncbi:MAG: YbaB/EbfC family nucleoid-associated protein [Acetobacteraceae bacterium]|nr:YbaB/EbfC family nucleoid-associated protein [Acetobacteraceae bacterium]
MKNLGNMLKQAQEVQTRMAEMQARLSAMEVSGQSAAGMVSATLSGKGEVRKVKIDASLVDPAEVEVLEDLIVAAINDARARAEAAMAEEMAKVTGGLSLPPGLKLPGM